MIIAVSTKRSKVFPTRLQVEIPTLKFGLFYFDGWIYSHFKRREPSSAWQARLYYITEAVRCFFTAGRDFLSWHWPLLPGPLLKTGFFMIWSKQGSCLGSAPTLVQRQTPFCYFLNEQSGCNQPVCQLLSVKKWSGQNSLKEKYPLSPVSFQRWSLSTLHLQYGI